MALCLWGILRGNGQTQVGNFLTVHARDGVRQVLLLFMDKLPLYKLPENWYHLEWDKDKEIYKLVWRSDQQELHIDRLKCQR